MLPTLLSHIISFPGLGIGEFEINPVAFRLPLPWVEGGHPIMWYGIIIAIAMVTGFSVALGKSKWEGVKSDDIFDVAIFLIIFSILGARLYYVAMNPSCVSSFLQIFAIWDGGLAIYGGIIAGALTLLVFSKIAKIKTTKLLDIASPGLIIGQAIGRWGNFFNAEAHGIETTLPFRMGIIRNGVGEMHYYHPTFLYECLWNLVGFALISIFYKKKKYDGQVTLFYITWYGFGRFFIEGLRTDSLYLLESLLGRTVRVSQLVAAVCVIVGITLLTVFGIRTKKKVLEASEYESVYSDENNFEKKEEIKNGENN